jgi:hypothetical protein
MPPMIAGASLASVEPPRSAAATVLPTLEVRAEIAPILLVQSVYHVKEVLSVRRWFDPDRPGQLRRITETV